MQPPLNRKEEQDENAFGFGQTPHDKEGRCC
jgi:hypothetical protein